MSVKLAVTTLIGLFGIVAAVPHTTPYSLQAAVDALNRRQAQLVRDDASETNHHDEHDTYWNNEEPEPRNRHEINQILSNFLAHDSQPYEERELNGPMYIPGLEAAEGLFDGNDEYGPDQKKERPAFRERDESPTSVFREREYGHPSTLDEDFLREIDRERNIDRDRKYHALIREIWKKYKHDNQELEQQFLKNELQHRNQMLEENEENDYSDVFDNNDDDDYTKKKRGMMYTPMVGYPSPLLTSYYGQHKKRDYPVLPWLPAYRKKRFPVAKRSPKREDYKDVISDEKVVKDLKEIFGDSLETDKKKKRYAHDENDDDKKKRTVKKSEYPEGENDKKKRVMIKFDPSQNDKSKRVAKKSEYPEDDDDKKKRTVKKMDPEEDKKKRTVKKSMMDEENDDKKRRLHSEENDDKKKRSLKKKRNSDNDCQKDEDECWAELIEREREKEEEDDDDSDHDHDHYRDSEEDESDEDEDFDEDDDRKKKRAVKRKRSNSESMYHNDGGLIDLKKRDVQWSNIFGMDRKKKSVGSEYPLSFYKNYDQNRRHSLDLSKIDNMNHKLKTIEDLLIDETVKYTGAHEGSIDPEDIKELKDHVVSRLATAYNLEKMRHALDTLKENMNADEKLVPEEDNKAKRVAVKKEKAEFDHSGHKIDDEPKKVKLDETENHMSEDNDDKKKKKEKRNGVDDLLAAINDPQDLVSVPGECPILENIERRCRGVDALSGDIHQSLMPACGIHQLCYLCGTSQSECDFQYLADAETICDHHAGCESAARSALMVLRGFPSPTLTPRGCAKDPCLYQALKDIGV